MSSLIFAELNESFVILLYISCLFHVFCTFICIFWQFFLHIFSYFCIFYVLRTEMIKWKSNFVGHKFPPLLCGIKYIWALIFHSEKKNFFVYIFRFHKKQHHWLLFRQKLLLGLNLFVMFWVILFGNLGHWISCRFPSLHSPAC